MKVDVEGEFKLIACRLQNRIYETRKAGYGTSLD